MSRRYPTRDRWLRVAPGKAYRRHGDLLARELEALVMSLVECRELAVPHLVPALLRPAS